MVVLSRVSGSTATVLSRAVNACAWCRTASDQPTRSKRPPRHLPPLHCRLSSPAWPTAPLRRQQGSLANRGWLSLLRLCSVLSPADSRWRGMSLWQQCSRRTEHKGYHISIQCCVFTVPNLSKQTLEYWQSRIFSLIFLYESFEW